MKYHHVHGYGFWQIVTIRLSHCLRESRQGYKGGYNMKNINFLDHPVHNYEFHSASRMTSPFLFVVLFLSTVTRVRSQGHIRVSFNVVTRDMKKLGFDVTPSSLSIPSAATTAAFSSDANPGAEAAAIPTANVPTPSSSSTWRDDIRWVGFGLKLCVNRHWSVLYS